MDKQPNISMNARVQEKEYYLTGTGIPVVLLHSSMSSKEQWLKLCDLIADRYQVIAIDLLGYGNAPFPGNPESFSLLDEVERIDQIIVDLIGNRQFHFIGHSYGGATALRHVYAHQNRVMSLCLYEPVAFHLLDPGSAILAGIDDFAGRVKVAVEDGNRSQATEMFIDFWSGTGTYSRLSDSRKNMLDSAIGKVILDFKAGIHEPLRLDDYRSIITPACLITGGRSRAATRRITEHLAETLPHAQLHRVDGTHMAPVADAEAVNPIMTGFIRSLQG